MKQCFLMAAFLVSFCVTRAQIEIRPWVSAGYGLENYIGFRGLTVQGELAVGLTRHVEGVVLLNYFSSSNVPKWDKAMNEGSYYHQITSAIKFLYHTNEDGTGFLFSGGLAFRNGKTNHFLTGDLHDGVFTNDQFTTEQLRGRGFVGGFGYGFNLGEKLSARVEFSHYAFTSLNDMQTLTLKIGF
jgi:hypothetical protein